MESPEDQLTEPPNINKSMRSMSRSTFDSIIDDFIEDDWEKRSAFGVSLAVVLIWTIFLTLLGVALVPEEKLAVARAELEELKKLELKEKDVIKFGYSTREYVLLHENSEDEA